MPFMCKLPHCHYDFRNAKKGYKLTKVRVNVDHYVKQRTKLHLLYFVQVYTLEGITKQLIP